jgi:hypothetical protein
MNPPIVMMISAYDPNPTIPLITINSPNAMIVLTNGLLVIGQAPVEQPTNL